MNMKRFIIFLSLAVLLLTIIVYAAAWYRAAPDRHFVGYIYNAPDGASYLAKMRLGWLGHWRYRLMFTPEDQSGAYLFIFYLGLGHLARLSGVPLAVVYHLARIMGGAVLLIALGWLCKKAMPDEYVRRWGYAFALFGGGVGWAFTWAKPMPVDLWVPEGYAFYSILVNAHFPWAQALLLLIFACTAMWRSGSISTCYAMPAISLMLILLGVLQPFEVVLVGLVWFIWLILEWIMTARFSWKLAVLLAGIGTLGLLYPVYCFLAIQRDPFLAAWDAQNVTASPPLWNWLIGYALTIPWIVPGAFKAWRTGRPLERILLAWIIGSLLAMFAPISLQRRFCLGLSIPLGVLAGLGWGCFLSTWQRRSHWLNPAKAGMALLLLLTPLFLLLEGFIMPARAPERFYAHDKEIQAAQILLSRDPAKVILASRERGEAIPWMTGHPVLVGHPLETVKFARREREALHFFNNSWRPEERRAFLCRENVGFVWLGPMEKAIGGSRSLNLPGVHLTMENDDLKLYSVECDGFERGQNR
jgi:hypothetical protein